MSNICGHHIDYNKNNSCFSDKQIMSLVMQYNNAIKQNKLNGKNITLDNNIKKMYLQLKKQLSTCNGNEKCWIKQNFVVNKKNLLSVFKPQGTKNRFDWLSTIDINAVMKQFELKYPNFLFAGAIPRDILKLNNYNLMSHKIPIKNLEIKHLLDLNKNIIAFIYNLDESHQSGSHWVALYCDISNCKIYFFDSYGDRPHKDIRMMIRKLALMCYNYKKYNCIEKCKDISISESFMNNKITNKNKIEKNMNEIEWNRNRFQYKNTECGIYSIYFITKLLEGTSFDTLIKNPIPDDIINKERDKLFIQLD